ncbi:MAG: aminodeoxychorismate/anthranilate synthase component II [Cyclobacteriaceae bacterium]
MKILVFDNYDSFTYNLVHIIKELGYGAELDVIRNDKLTIKEVGAYDKILLSPGPGVPSDAGIMPELIKEYGATKSILGVCLGHQGIGEAFGAELYNLDTVIHGFGLNTHFKEDYLFQGMPSAFDTGRYHSWAITKESLEGTPLEVIADDENGVVMGIRHKKYDIRGVQFHPESYLTRDLEKDLNYGKKMIENWLKN